ncbi:Panacea domain-containing protein [Phaeobacter sp. HF9A]|uniref:Panacea domain-containing protein n=1 Tax=Phaeobacter sp. HF9A TaxID=2721561 RepID=UPI0014306DBA|nr:Panacea domain-containing protein [Phaeobacter sp. HF9A]NIZ11944.1 SocA family protein [Phaeobacter sp. HF9A]
MSYDPRKAAQTIAYLAVKNEREPLNILKAIKLVYLADRESVRRSGFTIQDEPHYSMPHGPVNSTTYRFINGEVPPQEANGWSEFLTDRNGHRVGLANPQIDPDDLDELSDAEIAVLDDVWEQFGHLTQWQLVEWTHDPHNVPEWEDPHGSSAPIPLRRMMDALGIQNAADQETFVREQRRSSAYLKAL